ncbi:bacteriochlorophyll synthetase bchg [Heliomicrobium modesticaldum Ice1]|uniref:Bacteriochlorophyll synthetase bchg n=1 Tax=Heliobacterium modesticaldum (strain ATCC 51547 / Ice1) TaxID=498761 RepID=B0TBM1_HELMI|nr:chlorophyll synthase ChlG [Heliomicrobium modesticaldum]ABZ83860.1 bacteriochlorophyll synthetase bchg [Heliomicrobium modesticaldum Ice1]
MSVDINRQSQSPTTTPSQEPLSIWRVRLQLTKPLTWIGPVWSVGCGVVGAAGADLSVDTFLRSLLLMVVIGPLVLGMGQSINDYYDADVDAINEPDRPCARFPELFKRLALTNVAVLSAAALVVSYIAFPIEIFLLVLVGLFIAYIYSAPPLRLKQNGWFGNTACALTYVTLPWIAGNYLFDSVTPEQTIVAFLYAIGSHGFMTMNDFKSVEGDKACGLRSMVVMYGVEGAVKIALNMLMASQLLVALYVAAQGHYIGSAVLVALLLAQLPFQPKLKKDPKRLAPWYNATANSFFILSMMAAAFTLK